VQALRRVPHTFFDAYFSGRYAQDVCDDGSIFVDRDGEHSGHVLEYMWDGHVSVLEPGARPSVSLLHALKREFDFYCIELCAEAPVEPEVAFVMGGRNGGRNGGRILSSMERYDASSNRLMVVAPMGTVRRSFGVCSIAGELYATGGYDNTTSLSSVEKYSTLSDTWSAVASMPVARTYHAAVAVGSVVYVLGGNVTASVLKFDSAQGTWSQVAPMPEPSYVLSACAVGSDIFVF
jgi:hypothetical protein